MLDILPSVLDFARSASPTGGDCPAVGRVVNRAIHMGGW